MTVAAIAVGVLVFGAVPAFASVWATGDIFVGVSSGNYNVYSNSGTFKETINAGSSYTTGCAFNNDQSQLFTTYRSNGNLETFATAHPHASALFAGSLSSPESVVFDKSGNVFVSGTGIKEFNSSGTLINTILPGSQIAWIDLAADQKTMFFTNDVNGTIYRVDVSTPGGTLLPEFASAGSSLRALRILPDGGVLVANAGDIQRYNSSGVVIQTYDFVGEDYWFALNLDPNGTSFWSADAATADVVKFNIASGVKETSFNTGTDTGTVFGLCLKGTTPPTCTLIATIPGPPKSIEVEVQDTGSGIASIQHSETNAVTVVPAFAPGTTSPLVIDSTKVNQSQPSSLQLTVTDVAGNTTVCDPVVPGSLLRAHARPHRLLRLRHLHLARVR